MVGPRLGTAALQARLGFCGRLATHTAAKDSQVQAMTGRGRAGLAPCAWEGTQCDSRAAPGNSEPAAGGDTHAGEGT